MKELAFAAWLLCAFAGWRQTKRDSPELRAFFLAQADVAQLRAEYFDSEA